MSEENRTLSNDLQAETSKLSQSSFKSRENFRKFCAKGTNLTMREMIKEECDCDGTCGSNCRCFK